VWRSRVRWKDRAGPALRDRRGWALISVLCVVSMLSLLAEAGQSFTDISYRIERRADERARADALLNAGVVRAVLAIADPDRTARWPVDGTPENFRFDGATLRVRVQDQFGCIDLNAADGSVLRALLVSAGKLTMERADTLADRIRAWRAPANGLAFLHGGSDDDYVAAGLNYRPRHGPFQSVAELKLVLGMTPQIYARIAPALTVYSKSPMIDPNVAPRAALLAYFGNDAEKADNLLGDRAVTVDTPALPAPTGHAYAITVETEIGGRSFTRNAVVVLTGDADRPYFVLAWG
jgi:general secretion pathway protein K